MATTYTRIKNRRGLKIDLPQPLADGEIGLATDTREVYIGAGTQDLLNNDVQVTPFLDAQSIIADDLGNLTSSTNNGILFFNVAGTEVINSAATVSLALNTTHFGLPTGHPKRSGGLVASDLVITKFLNGVPTTYESDQYALSFTSQTTNITFTGSNIPESGSKLLVSKWTKDQITEHARARAGWSTTSSDAAYQKWQYGNLATNQVYCDVTTGTGFVQFVTVSEKAALLTANTNDSINLIDEPTAIKPSTTYGTFLGEHSAIHSTSRAVEIDSDLKIDLDTPTQAYNVSRFINKKRGNVSRVASNIELFTEASYPRYQTNQYVARMQTFTLASGGGTKLIVEYPIAESNVYKIDYSFTIPEIKTITGATQANPVVITSSGHTFSNGDVIEINGVVGMTQLNGNKYKVANSNTSAGTFELQTNVSSPANVDGTGYTAYTSGGTATKTLCRTGTIHMANEPNGSPPIINDTHIENGDTSSVTFSAGISSSLKLQFNYANTNSSNANLSYKIERWLQS